MKHLETLDHQFRLADSALHHAEQLLRAKYWTSSVSNSYQVALRAAAGLLYGLQLRPFTEREVRVAFVSAFVNSGRVPAHLDASFRSLEKMREQADYDHDYVSTEEDARRALELAREFWTEAQRVRKEVLK